MLSITLRSFAHLKVYAILEVFNVTNSFRPGLSAVFGNPNTSGRILRSAANQSTMNNGSGCTSGGQQGQGPTSGGPRILQFALKYMF